MSELIDLLENPSLAYQYEDVQIGDIVVSCGTRSQTLDAYDLFNVESGSYYGSYITSSKAEQAMTSAIMNVTSETQVKAAVLSGHGEQSPDGLTALMEDNNFEIVTVSPATEEIPSDVDVLIWMAPTNDPDQEVLDRIDSFLSSNEEKTLLYFADTTQPELPRLESFLEKWGIGVSASSIVETDSQHIINMNPYFSTTSISNLTLTDTMTDTSIPITMPFARPLEQMYETNMDISTEVLLESTDTATTIPYGITEEELVTMVDQAENEGGLDQHESQLIRNAIAGHLPAEFPDAGGQSRHLQGAGRPGLLCGSDPGGGGAGREKSPAGALLCVHHHGGGGLPLCGERLLPPAHLSGQHRQYRGRDP